MPKHPPCPVPTTKLSPKGGRTGSGGGGGANGGRGGGSGGLAVGGGGGGCNPAQCVQHSSTDATSVPIVKTSSAPDALIMLNTDGLSNSPKSRNSPAARMSATVVIRKPEITVQTSGGDGGGGG